MKHTNKRDLANRIYATNNEEIPILTVLKVVSQTFDAMREALSKGEGIEVRGFGSFSVKPIAQRVGRNPNAPSVSITIPQRKTVKLKVAKELRKLLNP